jgi:hypothetical protein
MQGAIVTSSDRGGMRLQYPFIVFFVYDLHFQCFNYYEVFFRNCCLHIQRTHLGGKRNLPIHLTEVRLVCRQILMELQTVRPAG